MELQPLEISNWPNSISRVHNFGERRMQDVPLCKLEARVL